jgi:hypothetical protein
MVLSMAMNTATMEITGKRSLNKRREKTGEII